MQTDDELLTELLQKDVLSGSDLLILGRITVPHRMADYFIKEPSREDLNKIQRVEILNLFCLYAVVHEILGVDDPINIFPSETRKLLLESLDDSEYKYASALCHKAIVFGHAIKYLTSNQQFLVTTIKFSPTIVGKIPFGGLLSFRKDDADRWFKEMIERIAHYIFVVIEKTDFNKEFILRYILIIFANYMIIKQPERFSRFSRMPLSESMPELLRIFWDEACQLLGPSNHPIRVDLSNIFSEEKQ